MSTMIIVANHVNISHTNPTKIDMLDFELESKKGKSFVPLFTTILETEKNKGGRYTLINKNFGHKINGMIQSYKRISPNAIYFEMLTRYIPPVPFYDYLVEKLQFSIEATYGTEGALFDSLPNEYGYVGMYSNGDDEQWDLTPNNLENENIPKHLLDLYDI